MRLELKQEQALRNAAKDEHLSELASELGNVQAINKRLESELERARGELLGGETAITNLKQELEEKEQAIATLKTELDETKTELVSRENQLQQALQSVSPPVVVSCENEAQTTEEPPTVDPEPGEPEETDTTEALQTETQPKLYNPRQLAEWINKNCNPEKQIKDHNIRDWYTPRKTCEKTRLENEKKYGHKLDHKDKKGTLWFTVN